MVLLNKLQLIISLKYIMGPYLKIIFNIKMYSNIYSKIDSFI